MIHEILGDSYIFLMKVIKFNSRVINDQVFLNKVYKRIFSMLIYIKNKFKLDNIKFFLECVKHHLCSKTQIMLAKVNL